MSTPPEEREILDGFRELVEDFGEEIADLREEVRGLREQLTGAPSLLDREEAAELLGVSVRTLDTLEAKGDIHAIRPQGDGGRVLYPPQSIELYVERQAARGDGR